MWAVAVVAVAIVVMAALFVVRHVLLLIYVAALLAIGMSPLIRWGERRALVSWRRRPLPRWIVILVLYVVVLAAVASIAAVVVPPLTAQAGDLTRSVPDLIERAQRSLERYGLARLTPGQVQGALPTPSDVAGTVLGTVTGLLGGVFGVLSILILTFYFLLESEMILAGWLRLFPHDRRAQARTIAERVTQKVTAWLVGQLLVGAAIGATAGIALMLLGVPFFYVLAVVAAVGEGVPFIGPFVAGAIACAIAATVSWQLALATAGYWIVQQLVEANILVPRIMGHQVGLSGAAVIVAVMLGHALLGVIGAVLAVPTAAILQATFQELASAVE